MGCVEPRSVPGLEAAVGPPPAGSLDPVPWLRSVRARLPGEVRRAVDILDQGAPAGRPRAVFGNRDFGADNFLLAPDGRVVVIDWEHVGYGDPLLELMLLHVWPAGGGLLRHAPVDRVYCRIAGLDPILLGWYELLAATCGSASAIAIGDGARAAAFRGWLGEVLEGRRTWTRS